MKACLDVHYHEDRAHAAAIVFDCWDAPTGVAEYTALVTGSSEYEPGRFYRRELEPLLAVVGRIAEPVEVFVIDAYCTLSADGAPGLGAYLRAATDRRTAVDRRPTVIGVAKNRFRGADHAYELYRGHSRRPLFVTALGMPLDEAAAGIAAMAGRYRIPTLLQAVDRLARESAEG
jgi:deoxyribonuclease V